MTFTPSLECGPQVRGDSQTLRIILAQGLGSGGAGEHPQEENYFNSVYSKR